MCPRVSLAHLARHGTNSIDLMSTEFEQSVATPLAPMRDRWSHYLSSLIGKRLEPVLDGIKLGELLLTWPDGSVTHHGRRSLIMEENVHITLHNYRALTMLMRSGSVGFAESYMRGDWSADNLLNFFMLIARNQRTIFHTLTGGPLARIANSLSHALKRNSRRGSRRNIAFHYDLGNDFYTQWLDSSMSYSSAIYDDDAQSLRDAQRNKLDRVVRYLGATSGARVLEIGCGWGAMARHLAEQCGARVEGISLSREQLAWADKHNRLASEDLSKGGTEFRYQDYRMVEGRYDHVVSIEMFEAVGVRYWDTYFAKLSDLLERDGTAVLQVITIDESRFDEYQANPDFIQRYIFPGGMLPTKTHMTNLADRAGFDVVNTDFFGESYALTLSAWHRQFDRSIDSIRKQGFDDRFVHMWRYYLSYCEAGFRMGSTDVGLYTMKKR